MEGGRTKAASDDRGCSTKPPLGAVFEVPKFEPIEPGVFHRELKERLVEARAQLAAVRSRPDAWVWGEREREDFEESMQWYRDELSKEPEPRRQEKLRAEMEATEANRMERYRVKLTHEAEACVDAWGVQIEKLRKAIGGARE